MKHWVTNIKQMLNEYGFNYAFKHTESLNHKHVVESFKQRLNDCFIQKWRLRIKLYNLD